MALFNMAAATQALDDLLDHEREIILTGRIEALLRMAPEKQRLLARLPNSVEDPVALNRLRAKLTRNQSLLLNAARGIKAASARLTALREQSATLRTYGSDGASTDLSPATPGFNRRA